MQVHFKKIMPLSFKHSTPLMLEQHFHGAYGVDFNTASVDDIIGLSKKLVKNGIGGFFPTLVTDSVENIKKQIGIIKEASKKTDKDCAKIFGIHLEGIFLNPLKKGIHNSEHFMDLTIENYKKIEDEFIKIVTLAPELDKGLIDYLKNNGIKVQAGHCVGDDLSKVDGVTHIYNAMQGVMHRGKSTALSALVNNQVYSEVIADGVHVSDEALGLLFKMKPDDKIILVSDALPITYSDKKEVEFADSKIYYDGVKAISAEGTIAGSTTLLDKIVKILAKKNLFNPKYIENVYKYHNIKPFGEIVWDKDWNILQTKI